MKFISFVLIVLSLVSCRWLETVYILKCSSYEYGIPRKYPKLYMDCVRVAKTEKMGNFYSCSTYDGYEIISESEYACEAEMIK